MCAQSVAKKEEKYSTLCSDFVVIFSCVFERFILSEILKKKPIIDSEILSPSLSLFRAAEVVEANPLCKYTHTQATPTYVARNAAYSTPTATHKVRCHLS